MASSKIVKAQPNVLLSYAKETGFKTNRRLDIHDMDKKRIEIKDDVSGDIFEDIEQLQIETNKQVIINEISLERPRE